MAIFNNSSTLNFFHLRSASDRHWTNQEFEEITASFQASKGMSYELQSLTFRNGGEIEKGLEEIKSSSRDILVLHVSGDAEFIEASKDSGGDRKIQIKQKGAEAQEQIPPLLQGRYLLYNEDEAFASISALEFADIINRFEEKIDILFLNFPHSEIFASYLNIKVDTLVIASGELDREVALNFSQRFYQHLLPNMLPEEAFVESNKDLQTMGIESEGLYSLYVSGEEVKEYPEAEEQKYEDTPFGSETEATEEEGISDPFVNTRLHADHWAEEDLLGYERYAHNIEQIIKRQKAKPPLTIGVIAPWGQGKTTLMRYVERRFEGATSKESNHKSSGLKTKASKKDIDDWNQDSSYIKKEFPSYPCVWFNPWQYQSSEQIWAGMAHAIIHQLVEKLSPIKQEEFWFKLQSRRIDRQAIRRDSIKDAITRTIPNMIIFVLMLVISAVLPMLIPDNAYILMLSLGLPLPAIILGIRNGLEAYAKSFREKYDKYLQSPDYEKKLGYFHEVNEDLQRVFDLLVDEGTPALIFIDDLDRCSPQKVVEVIEAINLMMNAEFRRKCYFILGMDAEMVAASIDVAYSKMKGSIPGKVNKFGSVGWYFLDKFIQLPFLIPTLSDRKKLSLVSKLFDEDLLDSSESKKSRELQNGGRPSITEERVRDLKTKAKTVLDVPKSRDLTDSTHLKIKIKNRVERKVFEESFLDLGFEQLEKDHDLRTRVGQFAPYLDPSPRSIKRFANLLRFHTALQKLREVTNDYLDIEGEQESYEEFADMDTLAFWLILTLRWPLLVRWLQWEMEENMDTDLSTDKNLMFASHQTIEKARMLDSLISEGLERAHKGRDQENPFDTFYSEWLDLHNANPHLTWLKDKDLIKLFFEMYRETSRLERAFLCSVW
ncbi:MAG: KAP family NTPase [Bacteroidia bacterium]|nr:KAP family NTPase [Bacteroidia bacterium]